MMENKLFEYLKSINEECWTIEQKPDRNYHVMCKKRLLSNDDSYVGWLYTDIPNVRLNENGKYVIESLKEDETRNRAERRKYKDEQIISDVIKSGFASSNWELVRTRVNDLKDRQYHVRNLEALFK